MGMSTIFKYLGLAMEVATQAADIRSKIDAAKSTNSPGGKEITEDEMKTLVNNLEGNCGEVITRICQEVNLPVKSVTIDIELE